MKEITLLCSFFLFLVSNQAEAFSQFVDLQLNSSPKIAGIDSYSMRIAFTEVNPGKEETIVFVHGNSASKEFFQKLCEEKALENYRLIAVDLPGHGESSNFPKELTTYFDGNPKRIFVNHLDYYTFPGYARILTEFIKAKDLHQSNLHWVGWSLGAHVVTAVVGMMGESPNLGKVILTGGMISSMAETKADFENLKKFKPEQLFGGKQVSVYDLLSYPDFFTEKEARVFHHMGGIPPSELTTNAGMRTDPNARKWMIQFGFECAEHVELLGAYFLDSISIAEAHISHFGMIRGSLDPIQMRDTHRVWLQERKVPVVELEQVGHAAFFEKPAAFSEALLNIIQAKPPKSQTAENINNRRIDF